MGTLDRGVCDHSGGLTEQLLKRGHADAHLRAVMITASGAALAISALSMPNLPATAALWLISSTFQHSYYGGLMAALQITTPGHARGANAAVYMLVTTVIGLACGPMLIGATGEYGFPDNPRGVGYGIALVGGTGAVVAALAARAALPRYRRAAAPLLLPS